MESMTESGQSPLQIEATDLVSGPQINNTVLHILQLE